MFRISQLIAAAALGVTTTLAAAQTQPANKTPFVTRVVRASLKDIALTDAERTRLNTVSAASAPKFKTIGDSATHVRATLRAAREAKDTASAHSARRQLRVLRRDRVVVLRASLREIRAALTTGHQTQFDANMARVRRAIRQHLRQPA
jgi:hypothetical protein